MNTEDLRMNSRKIIILSEIFILTSWFIGKITVIKRLDFWQKQFFISKYEAVGIEKTLMLCYDKKADQFLFVTYGMKLYFLRE